MSKLSRDIEERLLGLLDQVADRVEAGESPTGALTKLAGQEELPPQYIRLLAYSYNTGKANLQRTQGQDLLEKTSSVPLIDASAVLKDLYPGKQEKAAAQARQEVLSVDYLYPPESFLGSYQRAEPAVLEKAASYQELAPTLKAQPAPIQQRAEILLSELNQRVQECRLEMTACREKAASALDRVYAYLAQRKPGNVDFATLKFHSEAALGTFAKVACRLLSDGRDWLEKEARAEPSISVRFEYDPGREPYSSLSEAASAVRDYTRLEEQHNKLTRLPQRDALYEAVFGKAAAAIENKPPEDRDKNVPPLNAPPGVFGRMRTGFTNTWSKNPSLGPFVSKMKNFLSPNSDGMLLPVQFSNKDEAAQKAYDELSDPEHEARMQQLQVKAMLQDMLANDPVISGHNPEHVIDAFNEIHRFSPQVASQPGVVRALLRRYLSQGQVDTHDFDQLASIEKNLLESRLKRVDIGSKTLSAGKTLFAGKTLSAGKPGGKA